MDSDIFQKTRAIVDELESWWISLFLWLSSQAGPTPSEMVADLGDEETDILEDYERRLRQIPTGSFTPLHFLRFPHYVALATLHREKLTELGSPTSGWLKSLNIQNQTAISYRND